MEFGKKVAVTKQIGATGSFEVLMGPKQELIHSKATMGHRRCETDAELDAVLERIGEVVGP
jgi:hypothetical protein